MVNKESKWLTIPVGTNEKRLILDVIINDNIWQKKHYDMLRMSYTRAPFFKLYKDFLEHVYIEKKWIYLYELNRYLIEYISKNFLGIKTKFSDSRDYDTRGVKHEKLLSLLKSAKADLYVSGPAAKNYIISEDYTKADIELVWKDYSGYPEYHQNSKEFTHFVSIWDLLFNVGEEAPYYIWGWRDDEIKKTGGLR